MTNRHIGMQDILKAENEALQNGGPKGSTGLGWVLIGMIAGIGLAGAVVFMVTGSSNETVTQNTTSQVEQSDAVDPAVLAENDVPWLEYKATTSSQTRARLAQNREPLLSDQDLGRVQAAAPQAEVAVVEPQPQPLAPATNVATAPVVEADTATTLPTALARRADELAEASICVAQADAIAHSLVLFFPPSAEQPNGDDMRYVRRLADVVQGDADPEDAAMNRRVEFRVLLDPNIEE